MLCTLGCSASNPESSTTEAETGESLKLFDTRPIGAGFERLPKISHVKVVDLDQDNLLDVLVCDCTTDSVSWLRQSVDGSFSESTLLTGYIAPARVEVVDLDDDSDLDILVAVLGKLNPSNEKIGSLVALENKDGVFQQYVLLDRVARISDVRSGDLDNDGDLDLAVTQFGYHDGELCWMENLGNWEFTSHTLIAEAGGIHGEIADMNGDDNLDIALLLSQEIEQVRILYGDGKGGFRETTAFDAANPDFGSSGIWTTDLDQDGDLDVLYSNGDAFDYSPPRPWPWHGLQWLENIGGEEFTYHRLCSLGGAVNMQAADYDQDGDLDIFATSTFNNWEDPKSQSLIVLENTDKMRFVLHPLANSPTHIQALDIADLDSDGRLDLVTGGMHVFEPNDRVERILLWEGVDAAGQE
ncbi:MAG: hypothetical protein Aurels2KO_26240 [Aureliella sp.]